ncbi:MAG: hypothetical protein M1586_00745 [Patescibacteria group bacterium]|nr:hypothetical protein [Patescibacteria group bacterium]
MMFGIGVWLSAELALWIFFNAMGRIYFNHSYIGIAPYMPSPRLMTIGPILLLLTCKETWTELKRFADKLLQF